MYNGRLEIVRTGKGETGNSWVTLREMFNGNGSEVGQVPKVTLENIIRMIAKKIIRFGFGESEKSVLVTEGENGMVSAQEVGMDDADVSVADYKADKELMAEIKKKVEAEKTPEEKIYEKLAVKYAKLKNSDKNFNKSGEKDADTSKSGDSNADCEDCQGSAELKVLEQKIAHQKSLLTNQQLLFNTKLSKLSLDLGQVQKHKLEAERSELKRMHEELLLQENYLSKKSNDLSRQSHKVTSEKDSIRSKSLLLTKQLSKFETNNLLSQQKKIKALQDKLALKYDKLTSMITKMKTTRTQETAKFAQELAAQKLAQKPLNEDLGAITGEGMSGAEIEVVIKKLHEKHISVESRESDIGGDAARIRAKINELEKLKLEKAQEELEKMKSDVLEKHKDIEARLARLKLKSEAEVGQEKSLEQEERSLKSRLQNFEKEKLVKRKNQLRLKQMELLKTKGDLDAKIRELEARQTAEVEVEAKPAVAAAEAKPAVAAAGQIQPIAASAAAQVGGTMLSQTPQETFGGRPIEEALRQADARVLDKTIIAIGARNAKLNPLVAQILKITGLCIEDMSNLTHRMLHVDQFPSLHKFIGANPLNLNMAIKRCHNQYGGDTACEPYLGTMAVKKCPSGYMRIGCCQCVIPCPRGYWPDGGGLFCFKSDPVRGRKYNTYKECEADASVMRDCELYGVSFFTKACPNNYERNGDLLCMQRCPLGWPDYGLKCLKVGNIRTGIPTVWQPGDEEYNPASAPTSYYNEQDIIAHRAQDDAQGNMAVHAGANPQYETKIEYVTEETTHEVPAEETYEEITEETWTTTEMERRALQKKLAALDLDKTETEGDENELKLKKKDSGRRAMWIKKELKKN
jgi:hypothetical protein